MGIQQPVNSGFGRTSEPQEVLDGIDLSGKVAIVTGGYSGIGIETVRGLAGAGATVIVPARDHAKAVGNLSDVVGDVTIMAMDLADRVYLLDVGTIAATGTPETFRADDAVRSVYLGY